MANKTAHFLNVHQIHVWDEHGAVPQHRWEVFICAVCYPEHLQRFHLEWDTLRHDWTGQHTYSVLSTPPHNAWCRPSYSQGWRTASPWPKRRLSVRSVTLLSTCLQTIWGNTDVYLCGSWSWASLFSPTSKPWGFVFGNQFTPTLRNIPALWDSCSDSTWRNLSLKRSHLCFTTFTVI